MASDHDDGLYQAIEDALVHQEFGCAVYAMPEREWERLRLTARHIEKAVRDQLAGQVR